MTTFLISDLHFGHRNILHIGKGRPFNTIEEHDQALIDNWNSVVKAGDLVYVLGDFSIETSIDKIREPLSKLNGMKHLILGNHDRKKIHAQLKNENLWQSIREYGSIKFDAVDGKKVFVRMMHFPILEFDGAFKNHRPNEKYIHAYGHIHDANNYDEIYKSLGFPAVHIGVDTSDTFPNTKAYTPIRIEDVYEKAKTFIDNNKRNNSWI